MSVAFSHDEIDLEVLRRRAHNLRWAAQPEDVIPLTAADPDFPTAPVIREAIADYVAQGALSYGPAEGLPSFREVVAATRIERRHVDCDPDLVLPTDSAAAAMFLIARTLLQRGDEALVLDPVDFLFAASVEAAGAAPRRCSIDTRTGRIDFETLETQISERTRMLTLCHPHNPLGRCLHPDDLRRCGELAVARDLWILADEIWSDIVYSNGSFRSVAAIAPEVAARTLTVSGFSKNFGLAGLRVGYIVAPDGDVLERLLETSAARTTAWGVSTISQIAAQAAYEHGWPWLETFLAHLERLRDHAVERLDAIPGVRCPSPDATYVLFPDVSEITGDGEALARRLLEEHRVAVVPGAARWFGPGARGHLRIAFPTSFEILDEGLNRIEAGLRES